MSAAPPEAVGRPPLVPPAGVSAVLTLLAAGVMAFLAVFALALAASSGRLADRWGSELAEGATVRITAPVGARSELTEAALRVLDTTAGVTAARALTEAEQRALLAPWFGTDLDLSALPVPVLIDVRTADAAFDPASLALRLEAEVPGAVFEDHASWREPLVAAADRLRLLGWLSALLIAVATGVIVALSALAALAANREVIEVLRLVGATDRYIARAFVGRFTRQAATGAAIGAALGALSMATLPSAGPAAGILTGLGLGGWHWLWPPAVPLFAAAVAYLTTELAARRVLGRLP